MEFNESIFRQAILDSDRDILGKVMPEIWALIDNNPFAERMKFLLAHQELAKKPVKKRWGGDSPPNCIGTAFFVAGVSYLDCPYHGHQDELSPHMSNQKHTGRWDDALRTHYERRVPGAFIFSFSVERDGWHAGIYLGAIGDHHLSFAQHGHGEPFGPELIMRNYADPDYYIPATLQSL